MAFSKKKIISVVLFLVILISIPLGMYLVKQTQTGRSRASERGDKCIPSGDERAINSALQGIGAKAVLCQGAIFNINFPILFTAEGQEIYTEGLPTDEKRASIKIVQPRLTYAISGQNIPNIKIKNIRIDGNRIGLGRQQRPYTRELAINEGKDPNDTQEGCYGSSTGRDLYYCHDAALIIIGGNASGQVVENIEAWEPRSWSVLHIYHGDIYNGSDGRKHYRCTNATIRNNKIGPSGRSNGEWADGISLSCENSLVENNIVIDPTDVGIVVFGSPGSTVRNNTVKAVTRNLLGGIAMVDYSPIDGNYYGTVVEGNTIIAEGAMIEIGLGMGPGIWFCSNNVNKGGTVRNNRLQGDYMAYGYAVNGVADWIVENNASEARHIGTPPNSSCGGQRPVNPAPFIKQSNTSNGNFQGQFVEGLLPGILDISAQSTSWLTSFCNGNKFVGCTVGSHNPKINTCSDWGGSYYSNWNPGEWNKCNVACTKPDPNQYCVEQNQPSPVPVVTPPSSPGGTASPDPAVSPPAGPPGDLQVLCDGNNARVSWSAPSGVKANQEYEIQYNGRRWRTTNLNYLVPLDSGARVNAQVGVSALNSVEFAVGTINCPEGSSTLIQQIIREFSSNSSNLDQNKDGKVNELDFGSVYSR